MSSNRFNQKGFSLVEMVIYICILTAMLIIVLEVLVSITKSQRVMKSVRNIEDATLVSLERIERETRAATSINTASSTLGVTPGALVLDTTDTNGNAETLRFYLSNGQLVLNENGLDVGPLTGNDVRVTSLMFVRFASSSVEGIRTQMTIESGTSTAYRSETFYSSATLR
jgi:type II secretory pathway pseudopilin PulG